MNLTWLLGKHIAACEDFPERKRKVIDDYKYSYGTLLSERIRGKL